MMAQVDALVRVSQTLPRRETFSGPMVAQDELEVRKWAFEARRALIQGRRQEDWLTVANSMLTKAESVLAEALDRKRGVHCAGDVGMALRNTCQRIAAAETARHRIQGMRDAIAEVVRGEPDEKRVSEIANKTLSACKVGPNRCAGLVGSADESSRLGVLVGVALHQLAVVDATDGSDAARLDALLSEAEKLVAEAKRQAETNASARKSRGQQLAAEEASLDAATKACRQNATACKKECDQGSSLSCAALGFMAWRSAPPRFAEASKLFDKACEQRLSTACLARENMKKDEESFETKAGVLWRAVEAPADTLALAPFRERFVREHANTRQNQAALARAAQYHAALFTNEFCPAKQEFISFAGASEYAKRAASHCKDEPPMGSGRGGEQVPQRAACEAIFARACPPLVLRDVAQTCPAGQHTIALNGGCKCEPDRIDPDGPPMASDFLSPPRDPRCVPGKNTCVWRCP